MLNKKYFPIVVFLINIAIIFGYAFVQNLLSEECVIKGLAEFNEYSVYITYNDSNLKDANDFVDSCYIPTYIIRDDDKDKLPNNIEDNTATDVLVHLKKYDGDVSISKLEIDGPISNLEIDEYED